jgi:hypothetical protein
MAIGVEAREKFMNGWKVQKQGGRVFLLTTTAMMMMMMMNIRDGHRL